MELQLNKYLYQLSSHVKVLYPIAVDLLSTELAPEVRESLRTLLYRIGVVQELISIEEDGEEEDEEFEEANESGVPSTNGEQ